METDTLTADAPPDSLNPDVKRIEPLLFTNGYRNSDEPERIVAIEYHPEGPKNALLPFSVFTVNHAKPSAWISGIYDFDWCKRDEMLYYHCSGCGGRFPMHPLSKPSATPRYAVWWDASLVAPTNGGNCSSRKLSADTIRKWGYDVLESPLPILGGGVNPFEENACMDSVEYCANCKDYLPTESLCSHIWWCEKCADYSKPGERCKHRRG